MKKFYGLSRVFAEKVWDTMLEPLVAKDDFRRRFDVDDAHREAWRSLAEEPLGRAIERYLQNDLVRGLVFTDAKIGVFTHPHDETLLQNRCFLYHLIGNKTGEWKVPVGGMGGVARELERAARQQRRRNVDARQLRALDVAGKSGASNSSWTEKSQTVEARFLLVNFGLNVLAKVLGKPYQPDATDEGSVFKINMLLRRLPKLKATSYAEREAFCGTFHIDEGYEEMNASYEQASAGRLPEKLPSEVYCHTLTDDSILSPELRAQGFHTMTLFGLDTPWPLFAEDNETMRARAQEKFVEGMNRLAGGTAGRLPGRGAGRQSLHRRQKPRRYRGSARPLPRQHFPDRADVSVCRTERTSRHLGRRDGIGECVSLRLERAARRRRQRHPRSQRREEGAGSG